jgi:hypothetical protein
MPKFKVELWGDVEVEAESADKAPAAALEYMSSDLDSYFFSDVEEVQSCRFCGCTEEHACDGGCSWSLQDPSVCDSAECLGKLLAEQAAKTLSA